MKENMFYGTNPLIFQRAEELRNTMTSAERILWKHIHINKWRLKFRRQHPIAQYIVDFYCHPLKLVIEIDGGIHEQEDVKRHDSEREGVLRSLGLTVIRFKNEEIFRNPNVVLEKLDQMIGNLQSAPLGDGGNELHFLEEQWQDAYEGDPWFGRNAKALLADVPEAIAFERPGGQHSIVELVWHMINWKEFAINRLDAGDPRDLHYFEQNDWQDLDLTDKTLWSKGVEKLMTVQKKLVDILRQQKSLLLDEKVRERAYSYRKLIHGILQHDIYHLGQIAYITKLMKEKQ